MNFQGQGNSLILAQGHSDTKIKTCFSRVIGCGEGAAYLTSSGHPTDTGLQLGTANYSCSR